MYLLFPQRFHKAAEIVGGYKIAVGGIELPLFKVSLIFPVKSFFTDRIICYYKMTFFLYPFPRVAQNFYEAISLPNCHIKLSLTS